MNIDRRQLLRTLAAAGVTVTTLPSLAAASPRPYRALVCIELKGGIDGQDCLIPTSASGHATWVKFRDVMLSNYPTETRERSQLIGLGDGVPYGFAPQLRPFADAYAKGNLAVVANVGPLIEPASRKLIKDAKVSVPPRLASHNDQRSTWETLAPEGASTGWGGRLLDKLDQSGFGAMSVGGSSQILTGAATNVVSLAPQTDDFPPFLTSRRLYGSPYLPGILDEHFADTSTRRGTIARDVMVQQAQGFSSMGKLASLLKGNKVGDEIFVKGNSLSRRLAMVAKLISLREELGAERQVFCVTLGGFDTHRTQVERLPTLQSQLADAVTRFHSSLESMGVGKAVTSFTVSDFGRTLVANSSGTDHGWGNHHYVMGGAVEGGRVIGEIPPYDTDHDYDWRRGALIPTLSVEQYAAPLAKWMGADDQQLRRIFPAFGRFDQDAVKLFG